MAKTVARAARAAMMGKLKAMGLGDNDRKTCMESFSSKGAEGALTLAQGILSYRKNRLETAQEMARKILGLPNPAA